MSKLKCYDCNKVFDEADADSYQEYAGEFWGMPAYETFAKCPFCGSEDVEETDEEDEE